MTVRGGQGCGQLWGFFCYDEKLVQECCETDWFVMFIRFHKIAYFSHCYLTRC